MTGKTLLEALQKLTPEQLEKDVVQEGEGHWFYGTSNIQIIREHYGREDDGGEEVIALTCSF